MNKLQDFFCKIGWHNWNTKQKFRRCMNCDKGQYLFWQVGEGTSHWVWRDIPKETDCP